MGRKGRNRGLPAWYKGRLVRDDIDGFWYGEREAKLFKQEGKLVSKHNFDTLTDKERQENIRRISSGRQNEL